MGPVEVELIDELGGKPIEYDGPEEELSGEKAEIAENDGVALTVSRQTKNYSRSL
jgi:hypothetical protein